MARRKRPAQFAGMLYDASIRIERGETVVAAEDFPLRELIREAVNGFRRTRGAILAGLFDVENELVLAVIMHQFGVEALSRRTDETEAREKALRGMTFGALLTTATPAVDASFGKKGKVAVLTQLYEMKRVRDMMAHQPMWLKPVNAECGTIPGGFRLRTIGFEVQIADEKHIWTIDDTQLLIWLRAQQEVAMRLALQRLNRLEALPDTMSSEAVTNPIALFFEGEINHGEARIRIIHHGSPVPDFERLPGPRLRTGSDLAVIVQGHATTRSDSYVEF